MGGGTAWGGHLACTEKISRVRFPGTPPLLKGNHMGKLQTFLIAIILISVIPIIEVENTHEYNGATVLEYRNLISYGWEYTVQWYLNYKENKDNAKNRSEAGNEINNNKYEGDGEGRVDK